MDISLKTPKFNIGDLVIITNNGCLYRVGAYRLLNDGEYWYALHGYEYLVNEYLLELFEK